MRPEYSKEGLTMKKKQKTNDGKFSNIFIYIILIFLSIITIYPFVNTLISSLSPYGTSYESWKSFFGGFGTNSWKMILGSSYMWRGFFNSVVRTVLGSALSLFLQVTIAYPLSKKRFFGHRVFNFMIVLSTVLSAGIIPNYILIKNLGLMDTIWALIFPSAISGFNVIVLKNFYAELPMEIEEAAKIDGANDLQIFFKIIIHMALPSIATIALWTIVGGWNEWFNAVLYISDREKMLLPAILRELIQNETHHLQRLL